MARSLKTAVLITAALVAASAATTPALAEEHVHVVVSIKPIHSLVSNVTDGVAQPHLLIRGGGSPHTYSLRPSDAVALERADVVFWLGEDLEVFLSDAIASIAEDAVSVELGEAEGLTRLAVREGGAWDDHGAHEDDDHGVHEDHVHDDHGHDDDAHEDEAHDSHEEDPHGHGAFDPHVWLDPENAKVMVAAIVDSLADADPDHAAAYRENGAATVERLDALTAQMEATLAPVADRPFVVFHDAYHHLERRFGLTAAGSVTISPDIQPGAAQLAELRDRIIELGAVCVFSEPQFEPRLVEMLIDGTEARTAVLDPLGADLNDGTELYFTLMLRNAEALRDCLDPRA